MALHHPGRFARLYALDAFPKSSARKDFILRFDAKEEAQLLRSAADQYRVFSSHAPGGDVSAELFWRQAIAKLIHALFAEQSVAVFGCFERLDWHARRRVCWLARTVKDGDALVAEVHWRRNRRHKILVRIDYTRFDAPKYHASTV